MGTVAVPIEGAEEAVERRKSGRRERYPLLGRAPRFIGGVFLVGIWVICAIGYTHLTPQDPFVTNPLNRLRSPSPQHLFGTDRLGRDVFSRVIAGARGILVVAPLATLLGTVAGTALGLVTGYFGGIVDEALMRLGDHLLSPPP